MIVYRLQCAEGHEFDAWFRDSAAYDALAARGEVTCPDCGSTQVSKAIMAPNIAPTREAPAPRPPAPHEDTPAEIVSKMEALARKLRKHVTENFEDVGPRFAAEVRRIHDGEAEERGIYGEANREEVRGLLEDGIDVLPLPAGPEEAN